YECKATAQDRPYAFRPSRTQQLANPKLVPKLTSDVSNNLLRKTGIADEQLAKTEEERGRKRRADEEELDRAQKRSRSKSSITSVSTISTNASRSTSPRHSKTGDGNTYYTSQQDRSVVSSYGMMRTRKRRRESISPSLSYSTESSIPERKDTRDGGKDRNTRRRHSSISPDERGRHQHAGARRGSRRETSRSMDRSQIARHRRSMTPVTRGKDGRGQGGASSKLQGRNAVVNDSRRNSNIDDRYGSNQKDQGRLPGHRTQDSAPSLPRKERSLSPFSKRLALTQAMNMGR
ncbi:MAG: hypothetical protein M1830_006074, partial [Pleopsidium flavum]